MCALDELVGSGSEVKLSFPGFLVIHLPKLGYVAPPSRLLERDKNASVEENERQNGLKGVGRREVLEVKPSEMDFSRICDDDQPPDLEPIE